MEDGLLPTGREEGEQRWRGRASLTLVVGWMELLGENERQGYYGGETH